MFNRTLSRNYRNQNPRTAAHTLIVNKFKPPEPEPILPSEIYCFLDGERWCAYASSHNQPHYLCKEHAVDAAHWLAQAHNVGLRIFHEDGREEVFPCANPNRTISVANGWQRTKSESPGGGLIL